MQQRHHKALPAQVGVPPPTPHTLVLAPLMVGVAAAMVLSNATTATAALLRGLRRRANRSAEPDLRRLRRALLGNPPGRIAQLLGPPPSSAHGHTADSLNTWYYPIRTRRRYAMAIRFNHGLSQAVDFVPDPS